MTLILTWVKKWRGFVSTLMYTLVALFGYLVLNWSIFQTLVFIHFGFFAFLLNYFLLFSAASFGEHIVLGFNQASKKPIGASLILYPIGIFNYISDQFLLLIGLFGFSGISFALTLTYYFLHYNIEEFLLGDFFKNTWSFWSVSSVGFIILVTDFIQFKRVYSSHRSTPRKIYDFDALIPFQHNHKLKMYWYFFGSISAMIVFGIAQDVIPMDFSYLLWSFALNCIWAWIDVRHPVRIGVNAKKK